MTLNENIKKFRKQAGLTQRALAGKSGLSFSMISKLESGEQTNPSFKTLRRISDVLNVSPGELVSTLPTIEEQIDEYIEYKRGLHKAFARTGINYKNGSADRDEPYDDLNFKKKLQAINNIPVPAPESHYDYIGDLEERPEMRKLFSALRNASKDEINQVTRLIETFKGI
ncbi:MAG TPA: helix-turn-helix transcriptional regulator [Bacillota bacterium]|nr:helix-turn-helix transcriptional regulator [Bacillota bacterium]